jgi:hypothetical protein
MKSRIVGLAGGTLQFAAPALLLMCVSASAVQADPLVVTSGSYVIFSQVTGSWILKGDGFSLTADVDNPPLGLSQCHPCSAARPVPLTFNALAAGSPFLHTGQPGTFNNIDYPRTILDGRLTFSGPSFTSALLSPDNLIITALFTMTGNIQGWTNPSDEQMGRPPVFMGEFVGSGTATMQFGIEPMEPGIPTLFDMRSVVYQFESSAAPTPEPATTGLLALGLAVFGARRCRTPN